MGFFFYYFYVEHTGRFGAASPLQVSKSFFFCKTGVTNGRKYMRTGCELGTVPSKYLDLPCAPLPLESYTASVPCHER